MRFLAEGWKDYSILRCGDGLKQERWGGVTLIRPDPQILWPKRPDAEWQKYDGFYHRSDAGGGNWEFRKELPESWEIRWRELKFKIRPTNFKHTGLFPEQAANWAWISEKIRAASNPKVLNLFGYTGAATVAAAAAGATVCHVDSAKGMVEWCGENARLSGVGDRSIRYIIDDCVKFMQREIRRGSRYDAIMMDPPSYGRGSKGELWKLETHLWPLLDLCRQALVEKPLYVLINAYTTGLSPTVLTRLLEAMMQGKGGTCTGGELVLPVEEGGVLPCGIVARWER